MALRGFVKCLAYGHNYAKPRVIFRLAGGSVSGHLKGGMCAALRGGHIEGANWKITVQVFAPVDLVKF